MVEKFVFTMLDKELKFDRYENSFLWLKDTGLLTSAYPAETKLELINKNSEVNNGAHFENAVAQQLTANGLEPYFCKKKNMVDLDMEGL